MDSSKLGEVRSRRCLRKPRNLPSAPSSKLGQAIPAKVADLHEALTSDDTRAAAAEVLRSMICAITLAPVNGELVINLRGDLGAMLSYAADGKPTSFAARGFGAGSQESLVARAGFAPAFRGYEPLVLSYATTAPQSANTKRLVRVAGVEPACTCAQDMWVAATLHPDF